MKSTTMEKTAFEPDVQSETSETILINLAAHRRTKRDRFPDVEELLERLTDNAVNVANGN